VNPVAECDACSKRGPVQSRYERFGTDTGTWHSYQFCSGKCCARWLVARNGMPNPGIATSLSQAPGQERG